MGNITSPIPAVRVIQKCIDGSASVLILLGKAFWNR